MSPRPLLRPALVLAMVVALVTVSFWPLGTNWRTDRIGERWETALLELQFPFQSISERAERAVLKADIGPLKPSRERHVVLVRGGAMRLWVDGKNVVNLLNAPPHTLAWSGRQRLWVGGAPNRPGRTLRARRITFFDRALSSEEARGLIRARSSGALPAELGEPALELHPAGGQPGGRLEASGTAGPVSLVLPSDAARDSGGTWLVGSPAVTEAPVRHLAEGVRRNQGVTVEMWLELPEVPESGTHPVLAIAERRGRTNLRVELGASQVEILVRAAYPSLRRVTDCILNFLAYVPLGLILVWGRRGWRRVLTCLLLGLAVSLSVEALQMVSPDRTPSFLDLATNSIGALFGGLVAILITARS